MHVKKHKILSFILAVLLFVTGLFFEIEFLEEGVCVLSDCVSVE